MSTPGVPRIGVVGASRDLMTDCANALADVASVTSMEAQSTGNQALPADLILLVLAEPPEEGVPAFAWCRAANPGKPILLLARGASAELAVELVKNGAEDFVALPLDADVLERKVERALKLRPPGPVYDWSALAPLRTEIQKPRYEGGNRRHCFRAEPVGSHAATVTLVVGGRQAKLHVENLSIFTEGWDGGMLLRGDAEALHMRRRSDWDLGSAMALLIQLPGGPPLRATARLVEGTFRFEGAYARFAVQYVPMRAADEPRLRAFWMECQRLARI